MVVVILMFVFVRALGPYGTDGTPSAFATILKMDVCDLIGGSAIPALILGFDLRILCVYSRQ